MTAVGNEVKIWVLRLFSISWGAIFALAAYLLRTAFPDSSVWLLSLTMAIVLSGGIFVPAAMRRPYRMVERIFAPLGKLFALFTLGVVYFGVFTPFALALRLLSWDPLRLHRVRRRDSAWVACGKKTIGTDYHWQY